MTKYGLYHIDKDKESKIVTNIGHIRNVDVDDVMEDVHYVLLLNSILKYHNIPIKNNKLKCVGFPCTLSVNINWRQKLEAKIRQLFKNPNIEMLMLWT